MYTLKTLNPLMLNARFLESPTLKKNKIKKNARVRKFVSRSKNETNAKLL
jgi:hypothetical protein